MFLYLLPKAVVGDSNSRISMYGLALSVFFSVVLFFSSDFILHTLFPRYIEAGQLIRIVAFGTIPMTITASANSKLLGLERSTSVFIGAMIFLIMEFSLLLFFKTFLYENGLAIALLASLSAQAIFLTLSIRRKGPS